MQDFIQKYFQVGTIQWMSYPPEQRDLLESVKQIASDPYFTAIEVCHVQDEETREKMRNLLAQSHMTVGYGAQPTLLGGKLNPNALDETERKKAENALIAAVDEAAYLGAKGIAFLAGKWEDRDITDSEKGIVINTKELAYQQLLKTTRSVCSYAAQKNMMVELEVFDYDMDKAALIGPAPLAARFAADMRCTHQNFGLLVDLSHFPTTYETSRFVIQTVRPYITHLHIGNAVVKPGCEAYGDMHPRFGFPNSANDTAELVDFFQVLKEEGFFRKDDPLVLSIEVKPWKGEDPDIVMAGTKRVIDRAWSLVE